MSFRARLTLAYLALLTLALSVFGLGVYAYVDRNLHRQFYSSVQTQGAQYAQLLSDNYYTAYAVSGANLGLGQHGRSLPPDTFVVVATRSDKETELTPRVKSPEGPLTEKDLPVVRSRQAITVPASSRANELGVPLAVYSQSFEATKPPDERIGAVPEGAPKKPPEKIYGRVTVARSLDGVERSLRLLRTILIAGGLAVLLLAALLGLGLAAALLRPLARMRATAQLIGDERDFTHRMPVEGDPHDELGRLSASFNQMLAELEQSNLDLKYTLESQRRFVADASHELRTPLTAIRTNVEFLARVPNARTEDRGGALHDVLAELRRMESLVGDLLALARLEAASRAARRPFRLDHLLVDVHRDAQRLAPEGVAVGLGPLTEVWVSGEREDLRRALWNLVDNALKYTRAGRVDLRLAAENGVARLEVRDTGVGIATDHLEHVFDRFWRAPEARGTAGSGLGLAITKWVAQAHDGNVTVTSNLGSGTIFTLVLPVQKGRKPVRLAHPPGAELLGATVARPLRPHS